MNKNPNPAGWMSRQRLKRQTIVMSELEGEVDTFEISTLTSGTIKFANQTDRNATCGSTFIDCEVIAVKPRKKTDFFATRFIHCRFKGTFFSVDFGRLDVPIHDLEDFGLVEDCDFSQAHMDGCRFFNTNIKTLTFPHWPHVVIPGPHLRAQDVAKMNWPANLRVLMEDCTKQKSSACVEHVPSIAARLNCTPEEIRTAFEQSGGLLM